MADGIALNPAPPPVRALDHGHYEMRRSGAAPARRWSDRHAAAAFALVHVEAMELEPQAPAYRDPGLGGAFGEFFPPYRAHSLIEYGNRIGVFRLLDLLQSHGWAVGCAVNGVVAETRPALVRSLQARGVEILASGWSASHMLHAGLAPDVERALLTRSVDAVAAATGQRPLGYASQDYGYSEHTPALLEEAGIRHLVDWPSDERPFRFGPSRRMVMLPVAGDLDDAQAMLARRIAPRRWAGMLDAALGWWETRALPGSVLALPLHAWVAGVPHRAAALRRVLAAHDAQAFWQVMPSALAAAWDAQEAAAAAGG